MHVISYKRIKEAELIWPSIKNALEGWYHIISKNTYLDFASLKATFGSVDKVGKHYVFDIGGNKYRLISIIHFNRQKIYIREILTHKNYDKGK